MESAYVSLLIIAAIVIGVCLIAAVIANSRLYRLNVTVYTDPVSGGATKLGFLKRSHTLLTQKYRSYAVICMHISDIRDIIALYNPEDYHRLLRYIQSVLASKLGGDELPARIDKDTFCFLLRNRKQEEILAKLVTISASINAFNEETPVFPLNAVFGIYLPDTNSETPEQMLEKAIFAVSNVPSDRRYYFYDSEHLEKTANHLKTVSSVNKALRTGDFIVYFQPKIRIADHRVVGAESLIRWRTSRDGIHSPDMFLEQADRYRIASQIDMFVFNEVCRTLSRWQQHKRELCPISVNLSRTSIKLENFADTCFSICSQYNLSPALIEFDLREDLLLEDLAHAKVLIDKLHYFGFRCAVDKFGVGACSLQMLGTLDIDTINLDRSFFSGDNNNRHGRYLLENVLKLAAQLQIRTTAVGVDNSGQLQYLHQAACDFVQGFYFFKPMPLERLESEIYDDRVLKYMESDAKNTQDAARKTTSIGSTPPPQPKNTILFSYNPKEDTIEFSDIFSPVLAGKTTFENALALFRTTDLVHENDRKDFFRLLERCQRETGWAENTLRFYMLGGRYEWLQVRMHRDEPITDSIISGALVDMSGWKNEVNRWKEKATRDPLTGVFNREHFEQHASSILEQKKLDTAALLFVDIDYFKSFNDTYGHMLGDDVLCYVAKQIMGVFRHSDVIARYGGDEFVVFAPSIEKTVLVERLDKLIKTFQYPYRNGSLEMKVTVTIGAAMFPQDGSDYDSLLGHADCALYEAKERGRNQYAIYEPFMKGETSKS